MGAQGSVHTASLVARSPLAGYAHAVLRARLWMALSLLAWASMAGVVRAEAALSAADIRGRLKEAEALLATGKRSQATRLLDPVLDAFRRSGSSGTGTAETLALVGRAAHLSRSWRLANDMYSKAEHASDGKKEVSTFVELLVWRAELFLEKYDADNAGKLLDEALRADPNHVRAHVLMARVVMESTLDFGRAEAFARAALKLAPTNSGGRAIQATVALRNMDLPAAHRALDAGLGHTPDDLELLALKAAAYFLGDDVPSYREALRRVLERNPEYARAFLTIAEFAEWEHRYPEIVDLMGEARGVDPGEPKVYAALGLNLIRMGREKEGLASLDQAWKLDPFNVRVFNTLTLFEKQIPKDYVTVEDGPFSIRYHKDERRVLERYVPRLLKRAYADMVKRYGFAPDGPIGVEMYPSTKAFGVRTAGLPNVGIQGVCFGKTLAMLSPGAGEINWGNVLWHELAHVFAIQKSRGRVPRWFTEGLSEYETLRARPEWKREEEMVLLEGMGRLPPVVSMNRAFTEAENMRDMTRAYFASSLLVEHLSVTFGFDRVVSTLGAWAGGSQTDALQTSLGPGAGLDIGFRSFLERRFERYRKQFIWDVVTPSSREAAQRAVDKTPKSVRAWLELAVACLEQTDAACAKKASATALALDPRDPHANFLALRLAFSRHEVAEVERLLTQLWDVGGDGYVSRMFEARFASVRSDRLRERQALEKAAAWDPSQSEPAERLSVIARQRGHSNDEVAWLERWAMLDQNSREAWGRLLAALVRRGDWERAAKVGESALYVDVMNPEIHHGYARALARLGRGSEAVFEVNSAILAEGDPEARRKLYRALASGYDKLGAKEHAKTAQAMGADP